MTTPETRYGLIAASLVRAFLVADTRAVFDTIKSAPNPQQLAFTLAQALAGCYFSENLGEGVTPDEATARAVAAVDRDIARMLGSAPDAPEDITPG